LLIALVIGTALSLERIADFAGERLGLSELLARVAVIAGALALAIPFLVGLFDITRRLGLSLAVLALPAAAKGKVDLAAAPRRALVITLQLTVALLVGLPLLAVTQAFLPGWVAALALFVGLAILGVIFWRSATNLEGHVKAGAQMIIEALAARSGGSPASHDDDDALERIRHLMPGLGEPTPVRLRDGHRGVGRTLAELDLRSQTGASVLAIARGADGVIAPGAGERFQAGDVVALSGSAEAVAAATELLTAPE
jgi:CPA2 family monovalent cation:H+ antiporter-2